MMLDEFLTDAALAVVIVLTLVGLIYWLYLTATHRADRRVATELDELAKKVLGRLDARCGYKVAAPDPLRLQYRLESVNGKAMRGGSITFQQFTSADWYRTGVHKVIRAAIEAENPGWTIVGYHILPDNGEEASG